LELSDTLDRFRGPLIGLIASWGATYADAVELAQDSFADAYLSRDACRGDCEDPEVFGRWLRGVARNKFRSELRSRKRRERRVISVEPSVLHATEDAHTPIDNERLVRLREAIEQLPAKQRQVVMMHYLEETSVKEVAALLSVSAKAVEGRLFQARRAIKRMMGNTSSKWIGKALLL
jgi:RNA polymerase sigma-70 factor (ECF subfamily)